MRGEGPYVEQIETRADLVRLLKLKMYREEGVPFETLIHLGLPFPEAAAIELTRAGYEMEVLGTGGGRHLRLLHEPKVGNRRRKRRQQALFEMSRYDNDEAA